MKTENNDEFVKFQKIKESSYPSPEFFDILKIFTSKEEREKILDDNIMLCGLCDTADELENNSKFREACESEHRKIAAVKFNLNREENHETYTLDIWFPKDSNLTTCSE